MSAGLPAPKPLRRWRDEILIALLLAWLASALAFGGWAWRLDRLVYDLGLTLWGRPPPPGIVIVAIDEASIDAIGRWPWRRAVHATLLEQLAQARPKAVALDLVLSEPDPDPTQDQLLARALRQAAPVVVPISWAATTASGLSSAFVLLEPAALLREAASLGAAESVVDADGVLRHAFLQAGPVSGPYPHLALALLQAGGEGLHADVYTESNVEMGTDQSAERDGWQRDGRFLVRYSGPPGTVRRVSYLDVLSGAVPASQLTGQYVLVGMTAQGLGDTLATPVNRSHQAMPGIEVLANTLYTLRSGDSIRPLQDSTVALLSAALLMALLLSFGRFGSRTALPTAVAAAPLAVAASLLALRSGIWCSPVPFAVAAVLAYPLWSWRRLERAVSGLDDEIARFNAEPVAAALPGAAELAQTAAKTTAKATAKTTAKTTAQSAAKTQVRDSIEDRLLTLQRAATLLRQARSFLGDALAAVPTAILVADEQARVLLANPEAARLFEVETANELLGLDLLRLLAELDQAGDVDWPQALADLQPGGPGVAVEGRLAPRGDFVIHAAAVALQGQRRLVVAVADVEPVKQAQREREEALAFVSHDLRSPAHAIVLLADLQLQGQTQTAQHELLQEMRRLAASTLVLSEDFVRAAQAQTQPLQRASVRAAALLDAAVADLRAQALAAGVRIERAPIDGDPSLLVDRLLVLRALANLLSNAIKHSPPGATVELAAGLRGQTLVFVVRDHGPGLTAAQAAQIARGDAGAAVRDARGVGLGLLFVQRVARRHGGVLRSPAPAAGAGACFELELPR